VVVVTTSDRGAPLPVVTSADLPPVGFACCAFSTQGKLVESENCKKKALVPAEAQGFKLATPKHGENIWLSFGDWPRFYSFLVAPKGPKNPVDPSLMLCN